MTNFSAFVVTSDTSKTEAAVSFAKEHDASLIVTGCRNIMGVVQQWLMGSFSQFVIQHAPCDVLVARNTPANAARFAMLKPGAVSATTGSKQVTTAKTTTTTTTTSVAPSGKDAASTKSIAQMEVELDQAVRKLEKDQWIEGEALVWRLHLF